MLRSIPCCLVSGSLFFFCFLLHPCLCSSLFFPFLFFFAVSTVFPLSLFFFLLFYVLFFFCFFCFIFYFFFFLLFLLSLSFLALLFFCLFSLLLFLPFFSFYILLCFFFLFLALFSFFLLLLFSFLYLCLFISPFSFSLSFVLFPSSLLFAFSLFYLSGLSGIPVVSRRLFPPPFFAVTSSFLSIGSILSTFP